MGISWSLRDSSSFPTKLEERENTEPQSMNIATDIVKKSIIYVPLQKLQQKSNLHVQQNFPGYPELNYKPDIRFIKLKILL